MSAWDVAAVVLAAVTGLAFVLFAAHALWLLVRPTMRVREGDWRGASHAALRLERSHLRFLPGVRAGGEYTRALALHFEGRLEASLETCAARGTNGPRPAPIALLEGANLVLASRDPARAEALLTAACSRRSPPEDLLLLALAKHAVGATDEAEALFRSAGTERRRGAPSPRLASPMFHYLRALYLVRTGRTSDATGDLEAAARGPITTVYVDRARALLAPANGDADDDPRSSLAPQVLGR